MANQRDLLSPQDLVSKLKEGSLESGPALEGMVKLTEDDAAGDAARGSMACHLTSPEARRFPKNSHAVY